MRPNARPRSHAYVRTDRPRCARDGALLYYASLNETVDLSCLVDSFPVHGVEFTWTFVQKVRLIANIVSYMSAHIISIGILKELGTWITRIS